MFPMRKTSKLNKRIAAKVFIWLIPAAIFLLARLAQAQGVDVFGGRKTIIGDILGLGEEEPMVVVAKIIRVILGFLGILAVGLTLYGGWIWMTSEGNEQKIDQAKKILRNAVIGLAIVLASFGIVTFIINKLIGATGGGPGAGGGPGSRAGGLSALGGGIIQSHYPERNATDVPRNTKIVITFREAMNIADLISGGNINSANLWLYKTVDGTSSLVTAVAASSTADLKTVVMKPDQPLGSPSERIWYTIALTKDIDKADGQGAFGGVIGDIGYSWSFEVSTFMDMTPPKVESVVPQASSTEPRNVVVQINFDEAVDPLNASGATAAGFNNITVGDVASSTLVAGVFYISNQYRTVEFLTEDACGVNSCGDTVYCLPGNRELEVLAQAATLALIGQPTASFPADGVVDMADNSLDGDSDGEAQGPQVQSGQPPYDLNAPDAATQGDDLSWRFNTNNTIDITAPIIESITPGSGQSGVDLSAPVEATFSKLLMSGSLNSLNISLDSTPPINYWFAKSDNFIARKTTAIIRHDQFEENTGYRPKFNSGVTDIYQNCYQPCSGLSCTGAPSCCSLAPSGGATCP